MCAMNSGKCAVDITSAPTHGLDRTVTLRWGQRTFTCAWQGFDVKCERVSTIFKVFAATAFAELRERAERRSESA